MSPATPNPGVTITLSFLSMNNPGTKGIFTWNLDLSGITDSPAGFPTVSGTITPDIDSVLRPSFTWQGSWTRMGTNRYTSNSIGNSSSTWENLYITAYTPCSITVRLTASGESGYDYGYASILDPPEGYNGYQFRVSGTQSQTYTYTVPVGDHYIYFRYAKDGSTTRGNDNVVVEVVSVTGDGDTAHTLSSATGALELPPGYYALAFTVTKDGKSTGVYRAVHIYPGLTTKAEGPDFTFTDEDLDRPLVDGVTVTQVSSYLAGKTGTQDNPIFLVVADQLTEESWDALRTAIGTANQYVALDLSGCTGITSIGNFAFYECNNLTSVSFPAAIFIDQEVFINCTSLMSVSFPAATSIYDAAFSMCSSLTSVTLGGIAPNVGTGLFYWVSPSRTVTVRIPTGATGYGTAPTNTTANNWGNAFRGKGWNGSSYLDGDVNAYITLVYQTYTP